MRVCLSACHRPFTCGRVVRVGVAEPPPAGALTWPSVRIRELTAELAVLLLLVSGVVSNCSRERTGVCLERKPAVWGRSGRDMPAVVGRDRDALALRRCRVEKPNVLPFCFGNNRFADFMRRRGGRNANGFFARRWAYGIPLNNGKCS